MTTEICEVIITAPDADWLADFTRRLVDDRLAACGHNIVAIRSICRWQGATHDEHEARVALHTRAELVPAIVQRADAEHPYEVFCVIATPVIAGNPAYVKWVRDENRGHPASPVVSSPTTCLTNPSQHMHDSRPWFLGRPGCSR